MDSSWDNNNIKSNNKPMIVPLPNGPFYLTNDREKNYRKS